MGLKVRLSCFFIHFITLMLVGGLAALSLPPFSYFIVLFISVPFLIWHIDKANNARKAFFVGLSFGWGYFLTSLYWIGISFTYLEHPLAPLLMIAAIGSVTLALACVTALTTCCAKLLWQPDSPWRLITLATCWSGWEWFRSSAIPFPFSWNLLGHACSFSLPILQIDALVGPFSLSFFTVIVAGGPMMFFQSHSVSSSSPMLRLGQITQGFLISLSLLFIAFGFGHWRLNHTPVAYTTIPLRLIQPNTPQTLKLSEKREGEVLANLKQLSLKGKPLAPHTLVIWPEAAWPYLAQEGKDSWLEDVMKDFPSDTVLITGLERFRLKDRKDPVPWEAFNSLYVLQKDKNHVAIKAIYDKVNLVPFGEYLPLKGFLSTIGFQTLAVENGGYTAGTKHSVLHIDPSLPSVAPLICYEITFAHHIPSASWILNITNDAWFGKSSGPYQHLFQAQMRALEQGVPVVRVANSGITALIDPLGKIQAYVPLSTVGILNAFLPEKLGPTLYTWWGNLFFFVHIWIWLGYSIWLKLRRK